jgi:hypothetical protein
MFGAATMDGNEPAGSGAPERGRDTATILIAWLWYAIAAVAIVRLVSILA